MYTCIYMCVCVCVCVYIYIYICIFMYVAPFSNPNVPFTDSGDSSRGAKNAGGRCISLRTHGCGRGYDLWDCWGRWRERTVGGRHVISGECAGGILGLVPTYGAAGGWAGG